MAQLYFRVGADYDKVIKLREEIAKLKNELKNIDSNQAPAAFNTLNAQLSKNTKEMDNLISEAAKAGAAIEGDFRKKIFDASQAVNGFTEKIIAQKAMVKDVEADVKRLGEAYRIALKRNPMAANGRLAEYTSAKKALDEEKATLFGLTQQQAEARLSVKKLRDEYALYKNDGKQVIATNQSIGISLGKALGVIGGVATLKQLGSEIIRVRGEFQAADTAIQTLLGSKEKADALMKQVREYAKISPLEFSDVTKSTQMMLGFNIEAEKVPRYLQAIGDISMGETGKFNSLTLAFSQMSATGKLMGQDLNQMINAGFNPLQIISEKTGKSIATLKDEMSKGAVSAEMVQQAFIDATSAGGKFYQMSENASKTINGQISMMQDALDAAFNEMGQKSEGVIMKGIQMTTSLIQNYETVGKVLVGLIATYGAYRTAVMLVTAAESKHTLVEIGLTNVRILARKAQLALNAAMLTNPYVLLATAVVGLGAAMWAFHDSATEAEKAQNRLNEANQKFVEQEEQRRQKIEGLIRIIQDETETEYAQIKAYEELQHLSPMLTAAYSREQIALLELSNAQKVINKERDKMNYQSIISNIEKAKNAIQEYTKARQEASLNPRLNNKVILLTSKIEQTEADLKAWQLELYEYNRLKKQAEEDAKPMEVKLMEAKADLKQIEDEFNKAKQKLEEERTKLSENPFYVIPFNIQIDYNNAQSKLKAQQGKVSTLEKGGQKTEIKNKSYWEKQKKEANAALESIASTQKKLMGAGKFEGIDAATVKTYKDNAKKLKEAEKELKVYDSSSKQESAADKLRSQQEAIRAQNERIDQIQRKQAFDRKRQAEDLEMQLAQSEIDARADSFEKQQAQRELNNKKEIQAIQRQKDDYIRAYIQDEQEIFEAEEKSKAKKDKTYVRKTFDPSSVSVDTSAYDAIINNTEKRQLNDKIREQEDAWNEYLIKFGNYQQKKQALIEKYDKQIVEAKTAGEAAILEKEKANALDELDNSIKNSTTLMGQLFADASQKSANEIQKIIEKAELLMQYLGAVKDKQGNAQIGGETVSKGDILGLGISPNTLQNLESSADQVEALRNAIDKLKGDLGSKSPFKLFETQIETAVGKIKEGGKKNIIQGITEIGGAITSFAPAVSQMGQDLGNIFGDDELGNEISGVADAIGGLGTTAAGFGQIMSGDILGGAMSVVSGISSVVSAFDGLFGANYDKYNRAKEEYESYVSVLDDVIEKQKEMIASLDNENAVNSYEYAKSLVEKSAEAAKNLGKERLNSGASAGSHSIGVRIRKGMSSEGWDEARKALGTDFNKATEGRMTGLFDLSVEQLEKLKTEAPTFWAKLDGDVRQYLEDIIDCNESAEDLKDTLNENLTGISFDSLFDNFLNSLYDMGSSAKDISDDMSDYMRKSLIKAFAVENYKEDMNKWYEMWAEAIKDGEISSDEQMALDNLKDSIITGATESAKLINDQFAYLNEDSSQSATTGTFQAMSQDTGDELNGRFTALQMAGEELKNQSIKQTGLLSSIDEKISLLDLTNEDIPKLTADIPDIAGQSRESIASSYQPQVNIVFPDEKIKMLTTEVSNLRGIVDEMRTFQATAGLDRQSIVENTAVLAKSHARVVADIAEVKKNTSRL